MPKGYLYPPPPRVCSVCGVQASLPTRYGVPPEVPMLSITPIIYRRSNCRQLRNAPRVQICEKCLPVILSSLPSDQRACRLWSAIQESLSNCYSALLDTAKTGAAQ